VKEQMRPLPRWYRVEHRHQAGVRALGRVEDGFAHFSALDPFLAGLPPDARGEVVLVDEATGAAVARRHLGSWRRRPGRRRPPTRPAAGPARPPGR
jgi:hypothetical protein